MSELARNLLKTIEGTTVFDATTVKSLTAALRANLGAEKKTVALAVLREVVELWRQEKGAQSVPFEVEATVELAVAAAFDGKKEVEATAVAACWGWLCRSAVPAVVRTAAEAVEKSDAPSAVKDVAAAIDAAATATAAAQDPEKK